MSTGWTKVPNDIIRLAEMPASLKIVYIVILAQKDGLPLPISKLCEVTALSKSTIYRSIQILVDIGLLEKIRDEGYANKYITNDDIPVDKLRKGLVTRGIGGSVTRIPTSNVGYPSDDSTLCHQQYNPLSPEVEGVCHLESDHPRAYTNNKRLREKTKRKDYREKTKYTKQKNFKFDDWQKNIAEKWAAFCQEMRPGLADNIDIDQWANEIRLISDQYKLAEKAWTEILDFVRNDQFWSVNATSVMGLRNRGKSGEHKIVQIISRMPKYKTAAMYKAAEANYDPTRNVLDRSWTTKKE